MRLLLLVKSLESPLFRHFLAFCGYSHKPTVRVNFNEKGGLK